MQLLLGQSFSFRLVLATSGTECGVSSYRCQYVPTIIGSGELKSNPLWKQEGGLAKINEGLELLKAGKVCFSSISVYPPCDLLT